MENLKEYYVGINDVNFDGVNFTSIVSAPAIERNFVKLSKENKEIKLTEISKEKQIITGPLLIPEQRILRMNENTDEYFNIVFSAQSIESIRDNLFINNKQSNINIEHNLSANNITIVEAWIINDANNDKANSLGFDLPIGTLMISMKVNNESVWDSIKDGVLNGFSIEAFFSFNIEMTDQELQKEINDINILLDGIDRENISSNIKEAISEFICLLDK